MEVDFIAWLRERLPSHPCLRLGLGDDAAILKLGQRAQCVVTVDLLTDQVDFVLNKVDPRRVGHKALAVNLSDLAAMASKPLAVVVALALPRQGGRELAEQLYEGMLPLAERHSVAIAGGDTNSWDGPLAISITAIGEVTELGPLCRSGAQVGDAILATGTFGGSILGHHLDFEPRVKEALSLHAQYDLHAGIDVSDGLALDLSRLTKESGCGAELHAMSIPITEAARQLTAQSDDGKSALDHALSDGEDFELLLAVPPAVAQQIIDEQPLDVPITIIGKCIEQPGLWLVDAEGRRPLQPAGFQHRLDD